MCCRNICSIPLEFPIPRCFSPPLLPALDRSGSRAPAGASLFGVSFFPSNFFLRPPAVPVPARLYPPCRPGFSPGVLDPPSPIPLSLRARYRQVYFYSVRFIRLNMTCGYSPGDIFPILRTTFRLPCASRESPVFFSLVSLRVSPPVPPDSLRRHRPR